MTFNRLADTAIPAVQLHRAFDLECRGVGSVPRNTDKYEPFFVSTATVVHDLCADKGWMPIKHFLRGRGRVGHSPVVDGGFSHYPNRAIRYPFPEGDLLSIRVRLDLRLGLDVEYL